MFFAHYGDCNRQLTIYARRIQIPGQSDAYRDFAIP